MEMQNEAVTRIAGFEKIRRDYNRTSIDDAIFEYDESVFNNAPGLKSLVDIQILDFVCMNIDRHLGNMMFQFEGEGTKNPRFVGVQGIDNDLSFSYKKTLSPSKIEEMRNAEQEGKEQQFTQGNKIHISDQEIAQASV